MEDNGEDACIPFCNVCIDSARERAELSQIWAPILEAGSFVGSRSVEDFEDAFASFCGVLGAVAVGNGTDALELAFDALPEAEARARRVIVPANTFVATANAVINAGTQPCFVDVDWTGNYDLSALQGRLQEGGSTIAAIVVIHLHARAAPMREICKLVGSLAIVEDCAQAHGCLYDGKSVGTFGICGCFSFYPTKNLGALATRVLSSQMIRRSSEE